MSTSFVVGYFTRLEEVTMGDKPIEETVVDQPESGDEGDAELEAPLPGAEEKKAKAAKWIQFPRRMVFLLVALYFQYFYLI